MREKVLTVIFTIAIVSYPVLISILLADKSENFNGDVIATWERYQLFYMINVIIITVLLVLSTTAALRLMRKVFGDSSMSEERSIKVLLMIFCGTYVVRVIFTTAMYIYRDAVTHVF